jgi:hypothetical protein
LQEYEGDPAHDPAVAFGVSTRADDQVLRHI